MSCPRRPPAPGKVHPRSKKERLLTAPAIGTRSLSQIAAQPDHLSPELNTGLRCVVPVHPLLAIPQLLLSSACVILLRVKANRILVFPHRGLAPHQFTPMSGADQPVQRTGMSRSGQRQLQRQGRLIPVAYL